MQMHWCWLNLVCYAFILTNIAGSHTFWILPAFSLIAGPVLHPPKLEYTVLHQSPRLVFNYHLHWIMLFSDVMWFCSCKLEFDISHLQVYDIFTVKHFPLLVSLVFKVLTSGCEWLAYFFRPFLLQTASKMILY